LCPVGNEKTKGSELGAIRLLRKIFAAFLTAAISPDKEARLKFSKESQRMMNPGSTGSGQPIVTLYANHFHVSGNLRSKGFA